MSAVLDFPPIDPPPLAVVPAAAPAAVTAAAAALPPTIKETVLAQFKDAEAAVLALADKYRNVAFDVSTTKGMAEAKAARLDLRENGRFLVQRAEKSVKADVNDLKRVMADEVERIVSLVLPVEEAIDAQIKAEEERKAAAKAERERIEAERVATHQAGIANVRAYLTHCQKPGMTADRIATGIEVLAAVTFGPEWQEFAEQAAKAQAETLAAMRDLHAATVEREAAAAKAEQERIEREAEQARVAAENERKAAELAARQAELDAQAAELAERERAAAAEKARIAGLQAKVAAIHALPLGLEGASSWDIFEAVVSLEDMDVSEAAFAEFAPMATDARRLVLAALLAAKDAAQAREAVEVTAFVAEMDSAAAAELPPDDGARIVADEPACVESDSTAEGADLFGDAPIHATAAVDPAAALIDARDALREALSLVHELINAMDQSKGAADRAHQILARVAELRALGGI